MAVALLAGCKNGGVRQRQETESHELLNVVAQDYTLETAYPASIHGNQDIRIIPRVEGRTAKQNNAVGVDVIHYFNQVFFCNAVTFNKGVAVACQREWTGGVKSGTKCPVIGQRSVIANNTFLTICKIHKPGMR